MRSGIYQIKLLTDGRLYIGSSVDLRKRMATHRRMLDQRSHANARLQSAWVKYGSEQFEFSVLHQVDSSIELIAWEQIYIDLLQPHFNILQRAGSRLGMVHTEEAKAAIGAYNRGRRKPDGMGEKLAAYLQGRKRPAGVGEAISRARKGMGLTMPDTQKKAILKAIARQFEVRDPQGEVHTGTNLTAFARTHGLNAPSLNQVINGKWSQYKGWTAVVQ